jgi:hypothetical protein
MHEAFIIPGIVDGAVVHKQAQDRAVDERHPDDTLVHDHKSGVRCNERCKMYLKGKKYNA